MRAVLQRVLSASVSVDGEVVGRCGPGFLLLVGAHVDDTDAQARKLADRISKLRVFNDEAGKMNLALADLSPSGLPQILAVSNFTVYGNAVGQRRPSFIEAAPYTEGERLFGVFVSTLRDLGLSVETGVFGADMQVELVNDGPVTLVVDEQFVEAAATPARPLEEVLVDYAAGLERSHPEKAVEAYRAAVLVAPTCSSAYFQLGKLLLQSGNAKDALEALTRASELEPDHGATLYALAQALERLGRGDEARTLAESATSRGIVHTGLEKILR